jgi:hypothetical protein
MGKGKLLGLMLNGCNDIWITMTKAGHSSTTRSIKILLPGAIN